MLLEDVNVHRLTFEDVLRMRDTGVLDRDAHVELIDGILVDVSPEGPRHAGGVAWLARELTLAFGRELEVRTSSPLLIDGGFLAPDVFVVANLGRSALPDTALLAVEMSVTSQQHDRMKAALYARAGVGEYWLVDVPDRSVTVFRRPTPAGYAERSAARDGDRITPLLGRPEIDVSALLG
jgi:Uma2 family endonuclease